MTNTPTRYERADALKFLLTARRTTLLIFLCFLLLGVALARHGGDIAVSLGTSFIATALVSTIFVWIDLARNAEQLRAKELAEAGILAAFDRRNLDDEYRKLVPTAQQIDVTGYSLKSFSEQNQELFRQRAAERPIVARILVVNPDSEASKQMAKAEGLPETHYAGSIGALNARLGAIKGVSIRLLDKHLSMMVYRIDDTMFTGPYPHFGGSASAVTLKLGRGWLFDRQLRDFEALWEAATPIGQRN